MTERATPAAGLDRHPPGGPPLAISLPALLFAAVLLLTYGFEIFSFYLTIDEEFQLSSSPLDRARWAMMEGRWTMSAVTLLLPNPVVPVVSTGLGVALSGIAWWFLCRRTLQMGAWASFVAASLAGTVPVLAFIFSFSTVALAIGVGNILLLAFIAGIESARWRYRVLGIVAAAAAIAVYDTFIIAIAALALALVLKRATLRSVVWAVGSSLVAFAVSRAIGFVASFAAGTQQSGYTSSYFDLASLVEKPGTRVLSAIIDVRDTITLAEDRFGLSSPWLAVTCVVLTVAAVAGALLVRGTWLSKGIRLGALACLLAIPFAAEAIAPSVPLRSMLYLPIVLLVLCFAALYGIRALRPRAGRIALGLVGAIAVLSVLGGATISNRLFSSAATTYSLDQQLAAEIGREKDRLRPDDIGDEAPLVIHGSHSWSATALTTPHESLGKSFFAWDEFRGIQFLRSQGVLVHYPTAEQQDRVDGVIADIPAYPETGWVRFVGDVMVVNFGEGFAGTD